MKKVLIALIIFHSWLFAQTIPFDWASKENGYHNMVIDSQHRIHLVWIEFEEQSWYAGATNNYPNCIKYSCYNESEWSYPLVIDSFCPQFADRIELIIDNHDRLYLFYVFYTLTDTGNLIPVPFYRIMENGKWSAKQNVYHDYPDESDQLARLPLLPFSLVFTNSQDSLFFCDHNNQIIKIMDCRTGKWLPWKKMPFQYSYLVDEMIFSMVYG
ncbi:MAG: hypothetical protein KBA26_13095, partial [Candidatus Delongbacteria bacterium]|nr:hypothetical protein [Candidatus Delongbacteria bacterium]